MALEKSKAAAAAITVATVATPDIKNRHGLPKKKRGVGHFFKVALYMLRRGKSSKSKSVQVDVASKGIWKTLVGSMRPLHVQSNDESPPPPQPPSIEAAAPTEEEDSYVENEVFTPPMSPDGASLSHAASSVDSMSRFASAVNLQELEKDDGNGENDSGDGDDMIDSKADEFIARFYEQIRLQNITYRQAF